MSFSPIQAILLLHSILIALAGAYIHVEFNSFKLRSTIYWSLAIVCDLIASVFFYINIYTQDLTITMIVSSFYWISFYYIHIAIRTLGNTQSNASASEQLCIITLAIFTNLLAIQIFDTKTYFILYALISSLIMGLCLYSSINIKQVFPTRLLVPIYAIFSLLIMSWLQRAYKYHHEIVISLFDLSHSNIVDLVSLAALPLLLNLTYLTLLVNLDKKINFAKYENFTTDLYGKNLLNSTENISAITTPCITYSKTLGIINVNHALVYLIMLEEDFLRGKRLRNILAFEDNDDPRTIHSQHLCFTKQNKHQKLVLSTPYIDSENYSEYLITLQKSELTDRDFINTWATQHTNQRRIFLVCNTAKQILHIPRWENPLYSLISKLRDLEDLIQQLTRTGEKYPDKKLSSQQNIRGLFRINQELVSVQSESVSFSDEEAFILCLVQVETV